MRDFILEKEKENQVITKTDYKFSVFCETLVLKLFLDNFRKNDSYISVDENDEEKTKNHIVTTRKNASLELCNYLTKQEISETLMAFIEELLAAIQSIDVSITEKGIGVKTTPEDLASFLRIKKILKMKSAIGLKFETVEELYNDYLNAEVSKELEEKLKNLQ
jgi:hypothetical protein